MRLIELRDPVEQRRGIYPAAQACLPVLAMNHAVAPWPLTWSRCAAAFVIAAPLVILLAWAIAKALVWIMDLAVWLVCQ